MQVTGRAVSIVCTFSLAISCFFPFNNEYSWGYSIWVGTFHIYYPCHVLLDFTSLVCESVKSKKVTWTIGKLRMISLLLFLAEWKCETITLSTWIHIPLFLFSVGYLVFTRMYVVQLCMNMDTNNLNKEKEKRYYRIFYWK